MCANAQQKWNADSDKAIDPGGFCLGGPCARGPGPVRTVHHVGTGGRAHGVRSHGHGVLPAIAQTSRGGEGRAEEVFPRPELPQIYNFAQEKFSPTPWIEKKQLP